MKIRIEIRLPANVVLPDGFENLTEATLLQNNEAAICLVQTPFSLKHQSEMIALVESESKKEGDATTRKKANQIVSTLQRTFIVPTLRLELLNVDILPDEIVRNENGHIEMEYEEVENSPWYRVNVKTETILSTLIKALYVIFRDPQILKLSWETLYSYSSPSPHSLIVLERSVKSATIDGNEYAPLAFDVKAKDQEPALSQDFLRLEFTPDTFKKFLSIINTVNPLKPQWDLKMQYVLLAEEHFAFGDTRMAIIEMDMAVDICIREYLRQKTSLTHPQFDAFIKDMSTGELLKVARLCADAQYIRHITDFEELHNLRNTILHRYQRRIGKKQNQIFENAKRSLETFEFNK